MCVPDQYSPALQFETVSFPFGELLLLEPFVTCLFHVSSELCIPHTAKYWT